MSKNFLYYPSLNLKLKKFLLLIKQPTSSTKKFRHVRSFSVIVNGINTAAQNRQDLEKNARRTEYFPVVSPPMK